MSRLNERDVSEVIREERLIGYLDPGAEKYLLKLNNKLMQTTSSCTGRITFVEGRWHWLRDSARIVFKTHAKVTVAEVAAVLSKPFNDLWLKVTGPIIHVKVSNYTTASKLLAIAREAGFKHSGVMAMQEGYIMVELLSAVQLSMPVKIGGTWTITPSSIGLLVDVSNSALEEGWRRLSRLSELVERLVVSSGSPYTQGLDEVDRTGQDKDPCPS